MPSWPSRLLPGSFTPSSVPAAPDRTHPTSSTKNAHPEAYANSSRTLHGVPGLQQQPRSHSATVPSTSRPVGQATRHGRSTSHPFPSLFGGSRRADKRVDGILNGTGLETADDQVFGAGNEGLIDDPTMASHKGSPQYAEKDLVTGKCMTCDTNVRWPKHLNVFRCTVCLMINDLQPAVVNRPADIPQAGEASTKADIYPKTLKAMKALAISLERTRLIVDRCMSSHLQSRFDSYKENRRNLDGSVPSEIGSRLTGNDSKDQLESCHTNAQAAAKDVRYSNRAFPIPAAPPGMATTERDRFKHGSREQFSASRSALTTSCLRVPGPYVHCAGSPAPLRDQPTRAPPPPPAQGYVPSAPSVLDNPEQSCSETPRDIFRPLENYVVDSFASGDCLNASFTISRPQSSARAASEDLLLSKNAMSKAEIWGDHDTFLSEMDAKTLLLGDFAENGTWWTGSRAQRNNSQRNAAKPTGGSDPIADHVTTKTPRIQWEELNEWYQVVLSVGCSWKERRQELGPVNDDQIKGFMADVVIEQELEEHFTEARLHVQRTLLKATENFLRRPGRPLTNPDDCRVLLLLLANPLLYPPDASHPAYTSPPKDLVPTSNTHSSRHGSDPHSLNHNLIPALVHRLSSRNRGGPGQHSGIIKRILGLMSNVPNDCHRYLIAWFSRFSEAQFRRVVDLVGGFVTYRLTRQQGRQRSGSYNPTAGLIPDISGPGAGTSAQLHAALGISGPLRTPDSKAKNGAVTYNDDWQIKAAAKVMSLLFSANNSGLARKYDLVSSGSSEVVPVSAGLAARHRAHSHGQVLPTSDFYNSLLDCSDLIADFEAWESRRARFSFCQYPMFLSIWAKIRILEYDARRQMEVKAREAFFNSIMSRKAVNQYLFLKVRRECLVEDSLRGVSEVVGTGQEEIKKGLRIEFLNEEGIDAGGLRKEWFLLLVREVFDPEYGLFIYDEDSHYCYFNPNCFETSDQFFLIGVVLGLAIYNSTILDVAFPPFAFKKLLASAPAYHGPATSSTRVTTGYTLEDLAEFRPSLAKGLRQLLEFEGNVEETYCRDFVVEFDRYGQTVQISLCSGGEKKAVTNSNRREFVDLYIQYLLDTAVIRQFEPFKRGFFTVCGGNALSLFRPEEIELLIRGSDEPLDVASLRAVATYENWGDQRQAEAEPVVEWFWATFQAANAADQRKMLSFITGSDRIPAMGTTNLLVKISCLGGDTDRFPMARTCFNMLGLYRYESKDKLESKLWRAVAESEGFGLK